jgi:RimJ/RimL family protein N-acetyltransferase
MGDLDLPKAGLTDGVIHIRHWGPDDVPTLVDAMRDREISRSIPQILFPYSVEDARDFLRMASAAQRSGTETHLAVTDVTSALAGGASLGVLDRVDRSGFTGYWVAAPLRRRGIATRILGLMSKWGFDALSLDAIYLTTDPLNVASQRVAERVGFTRVGTRPRPSPAAGGRREDVLYRLRREEFSHLTRSN